MLGHLKLQSLGIAIAALGLSVASQGQLRHLVSPGRLAFCSAPLPEIETLRLERQSKVGEKRLKTWAEQGTSPSHLPWYGRHSAEQACAHERSRCPAPGAAEEQQRLKKNSDASA